MHRSLVTGLFLAGMIGSSALGQDDAPRKLAQGILDEGALLFAKKDAVAMAETYTETARVELISKDQDTHEYKFDIREGRAAIQEMYADLYKNEAGTNTAKNTVEYARRVGPDLLVIHGVFEPFVGKPGAYPFVQVRKRDGEKWLIVSLQLFVTPAE